MLIEFLVLIGLIFISIVFAKLFYCFHSDVLLEGFSKKLYECKNIKNFKDSKLITNLDIPIDIARVNMQNLHSFLVMSIAVVALILSVYNLYQKLDLPVNVWMIFSLLFPITALIGTIITINYEWYKIYIKLMNIKAEHFNLEKNLFNNLQQLGENMNFDEKQIESKDIRKRFETAIKENDKSFLDNFKDKSNLKYIQKLAELEISKEYSDVGTQFALYGLGLSLFIFNFSNIVKAPNYVLYYGSIAGILIIIIGARWRSLGRWRTEGRIDFLNDIILQVERKLP